MFSFKKLKFVFALLANAAKKEIVPYFGNIIEQLKAFLVPAEDEDGLKVQMQAVGECVRVCGGGASSS